jgi:hypothetical protein
MANAPKARGDRAEREAAELLTLLLGVPIRRRLGAGRSDDVGDLDGLPDFVLQVADWKDAARAVREKPDAAELQRGNAKALHAATLVRFRGGAWRVVLTPEQWARLVLEVLVLRDSIPAASVAAAAAPTPGPPPRPLAPLAA